MHCENCGSKISKEDKFCQACGSSVEAVKHTDPPKITTTIPNHTAPAISSAAEYTPEVKQQSRFRHAVNAVGKVLLVLLIIGVVRGVISGAIGSFNKTADKQEVSNIIKDSLNNTNTSSAENTKYVNVLKQVFEYYKSEVPKLIPSVEGIESLHLLEVESYKTRANINAILITLNNIASDLNNFEQRYQVVIANSKNVLNSNVLTANEKAEVIKSFDDAVDDAQTKQVRFKLISSLQDLIAKEKVLYQFMLTNFNKYEVQYDPEIAGDNVFFYSNTNVDKFQKLISDIDLSRQNYEIAQAAYDKNADSRLSEYGLTSKDLENFYAK